MFLGRLGGLMTSYSRLELVVKNEDAGQSSLRRCFKKSFRAHSAFE